MSLQRQFHNVMDKTPCIVYDVKTKKVLASFESVSECARYLGISVSLAFNTRKYKHRNKTNKLGKLITIR